MDMPQQYAAQGNAALATLDRPEDGPRDEASPDWRGAAQALLRAIGSSEDATRYARLDDLAATLRHSGYEFQQRQLVAQAFPAIKNMVGALLFSPKNGWFSILGNAEESFRLSADGHAEGALRQDDMQDVSVAWALVESVAKLDEIKSFLLRHRSRFADLFMAALIVNIFGLVLPLFSSFVYDKILGNGIFETLWGLVIGLTLMLGVDFCVRILRSVVAERFAVTSEVEIDHATFRNLIDTRANRIPSIGGVLEKYKQVLSYRDFLSSSYILMLADLPFLALFLAAIFIVSGPLVLIPIVCGGLLLIVGLLTTPVVLEYDRFSRLAGEHRFGLLTDVLASREAVVGSNIRNRLTDRWRTASVSAALAASKSRYWRNLSATCSVAISSISFIAVLVGGVYLVETRSLTSGGLLAASMLTSRAIAICSSATMLLIRYREFKTAMRELSGILPATLRAPSARRYGLLRGNVFFDRVTCRLRKGMTPVLNNVSLRIGHGEIVGIAGAPGAGKTTLLRLLAGMLEPEQGQILIDGVPVEAMSHEDMAVNIGFKPQECALLGGTVEDNVCAGRAPFEVEDRQRVLAQSGLAKAFEDNSLNWSADVGPRGSNLSGGQRQLVALARAMLGQPPLLILDEPTNGLDAQLEENLARQIASMRGKQTVIVSAHSRHMLMICDRIIVVGKSTILADGPRNQILPS